MIFCKDSQIVIAQEDVKRLKNILKNKTVVGKIGHFTVVCLVSWLGLKARLGLTLF